MAGVKPSQRKDAGRTKDSNGLFKGKKSKKKTGAKKK